MLIGHLNIFQSFFIKEREQDHEWERNINICIVAVVAGIV